MLPHHSRDPGEDNTVDGRLRSMAAEGYLPAAALASAELGATLDTIRANLRREQRAVMDLNCCLISRILSPVQASRMVAARGCLWMPAGPWAVGLALALLPSPGSRGLAQPAAASTGRPGPAPPAAEPLRWPAC
jgi:hypothetical protein